MAVPYYWGARRAPRARKKLFRAMPLTAAFGILVILIYAFVAIFAAPLRPYGQEQIIPGVAANIVPGGDPALGGNPDFPWAPTRSAAISSAV